MPNIIKQEEKPDVIQKLGNNTYYYNYNILPTKVMGPDEKEVDGWKFVLAYVLGLPEYNATVKALIREFVTQEEEFDLINSYNKALMTNTKSSSDITNYREYLLLVDDIKKEVKQTFNL